MATTLSPAEIVDYVEQQTAQGVPAADIAIQLGYTRTNKKSGKVSGDLTKLNAVIAEASIGTPLIRKRRGNRSSGMLTVNKQNQLIVGKAHLAKIGATPRMQFRAEVYDGQLLLVPAGIAPEPEEPAPAAVETATSATIQTPELQPA